ncbi:MULTISPECIES: hypothetical protein [unclassified Bradyrhizobium]|uniref:hypothetical protein n=1 Tax=unclassified Bradyrhizobium TaxID=2631580 RepID=UPI001BA59317|nr:MULTISPECIES: hypothetical protein [unclassified Bradyrhizobium]MBR1225855.1 hypothetical protein [Bradyrhizobium sp. AUGA SZCCT0176]MBR1237976.1 hypothetical protein [Bradyrhizobium sp. AUGA SZCCT0182]MBR1296811.1 hypothetical protein [Bradyrhizobium sp. AUGA SZCCT0042]
MADKSTFTADEWKTLLESVMAPGLAVTAAEPSGLWGLLQESFASGKMLAKTKMDTGSNPLIKAVVDDFATSEGRAVARDGLKESLSGKKPSEVKTACIEILQKVDGVLSAKAPGDAAAFKNWLREISENVAEASTEGGFLGIGGVVVSDTEKATLAEISSALKLAG